MIKKIKFTLKETNKNEKKGFCNFKMNQSFKRFMDKLIFKIKKRYYYRDNNLMFHFIISINFKTLFFSS